MNIKGILSHARNLINYMEPLNEKKKTLNKRLKNEIQRNILKRKQNKINNELTKLKFNKFANADNIPERDLAKT